MYYKTMNELKPEDVMKALECCAEEHCGEWCPFYDETPCEAYLAKDALALLREKDEDYKFLEELYQEKCDQVLKANEIFLEKNAEIEDLRQSYKIQCEITDRLLKRRKEAADARVEAITEFAERAKRRLPIISPSVFDQIAEELKGEAQ